MGTQSRSRGRGEGGWFHGGGVSVSRDAKTSGDEGGDATRQCRCVCYRLQMVQMVNFMSRVSYHFLNNSGIFASMTYLLIRPLAAKHPPGLSFGGGAIAQVVPSLQDNPPPVTC